MGTSQGQPGQTRRRHPLGPIGALGPLGRVGAYLLLFILGAVQGLIGSFQYSGSPTPLIAILLAVIIGATCLLAGLGMRTYTAGLLPALGWLLTSFILAMPRSNGSVIITGTAPGEWYLYGGTLGAAFGSATAFFLCARARTRPR
jgi:hypothetical protein